MGFRSWWAKYMMPPQKTEERYSLEQWIEDSFGFNGTTYPIYGVSPGLGSSSETIETNFSGYVHSLYKANGIVFACMQTRAMIFSEVRFAFQELEDGRPGALTVPPRLSIFEKPWPSGSTGDLLSRAIQDADLSGNHYVVREGTRLRRLRPDWVEIILSAPPDEAVQSDVIGFKYTPGGPAGPSKQGQRKVSKFYLPEEMAHWVPPGQHDPEAQYRGMSWLTPVIREIVADKAATLHKSKYFENAATPNLSVSFKETVTDEQYKMFMRMLEQSHTGANNAYKTLYIGGGADVRVIGSDFKQIDFKVVQGAGETRIAAAAGVHPVVLGISEGMQGASLNAGNFKAAKDAFADKTMRPLWRSICAAYSSLLSVPEGRRLWYDDRDIPFLRMDQVERAQAQQREASIIRSLLDGGCEFDSIVKSMVTGDWTNLKHTGLVSVQLLPPGFAGGLPGSGIPTPAPTAPAGQSPSSGTQPGRVPGQGANTPKQPDIGESTPKEGI
jgi:phage portal protein BeeE